MSDQLEDMETPVRRITRSQTSTAPSSAAKPPAARGSGSSCKKGVSRRALSDLTNDSPIAGLMPAALTRKDGGCAYESTPRLKSHPADSSRGEDLLRNQVATLLRKVETAGLAQLDHDPEAFESPLRLAAPTPANTPATGSWPSAQEPLVLPSEIPRLHSSLRPTPTPITIASPVVQLEVCLPIEKNIHQASVISPFKIREIVSAVTAAATEKPIEAPAQFTTRSLRFDDSPDKKAAEEVLQANDECTRTLLFDTPRKPLAESSSSRPAEMRSPSSQVDDDDDCRWSVIVNINSPDAKIDTIPSHENLSLLEDGPKGKNPDIWARRATPKKALDDEDYEDGSDYEDAFPEEELDECAENENGDMDEACEELCRGISHISMGESEDSRLPEAQGRHVRFNYDSDEYEIVEEVIVKDWKLNSPSKLRLKGFPAPTGKHLRFVEDQE